MRGGPGVELSRASCEADGTRLTALVCGLLHSLPRQVAEPGALGRGPGAARLPDVGLAYVLERNFATPRPTSARLVMAPTLLSPDCRSGDSATPRECC